MKTKVTLKGLDTVMKVLRTSVKDIENKTMKGLILCTIEIRRTMDKESPKIPVDTNNLRASYFTVTSLGEVKEGASPNFRGDEKSEMGANHSSIVGEQQGKASASSYPLVIMGFSANYAVWVHENVDANFQRPGAGAKFFESALNKNKDKILSILGKEAQL